MFEDLSALETIGALSMMLPGSDPLDDVLLNQYGAPYDEALQGGGGRILGPDGREIKPKPSRIENLKSKVAGSKPVANAKGFLQGLDAGLDVGADKRITALKNAIPQGPTRAGMPAINRMAGAALRNPAMRIGLKYAPVVGTALAAGDLVLGDESIGNKAMDAGLMAAGGFLGSAIPVVGTGLGITGGKMLSDGIQFVFGGGKSPEERKMEEALALLNGGRI